MKVSSRHTAIFQKDWFEQHGKGVLPSHAQDKGQTRQWKR